MKRMVLLSLAMASLILLGACENQSQMPSTAPPISTTPSGMPVPSTASPPPETSPVPSGTDEVLLETPSPPLTEDEQEMLRVVAAGKQFIASLQNGNQPPSGRNTDDTDTVEAFDHFFERDTLYVSGVFMDPNRPESNICMISGRNRFGYDRSVEVLFTKSTPVQWSCSMSYYYRYCDNTLESYLSFLKNKDTEGLATWMNEGQPPSDKYVAYVQKTIDYFAKYFSLNETTVMESDLLDDGFLYTVRDATGDTFPVELHYSDGLMFPLLRDDSA